MGDEASAPARVARARTPWLGRRLDAQANSAARGQSPAAAHPDERSHRRIGGCCLHTRYREPRKPLVSLGRFSVATSSVPGHWRSHHWCASLPICSRCSRKRSSANQSCPVLARRIHSPSYSPWEIRAVFRFAGQRHCIRPGRAFRPSGRRNRLTSRTLCWLKSDQN